MRLKDRVAIVSGGAQGIGEGIVICLAEEGADVAVLDIDGQAAARTADRVKAMGRRALAIQTDLTKEDHIDQAVKEVAEFFGRIDILVNNVGGIAPGFVRNMEEYAAALTGEAASIPHLRFNSAVWDHVYQLNLKSHVMLSNAVTPHFVKQRSGTIVNISSVAGRLPEHSNLPYATMKAADISLTWSLARGLAKYNITANAVCPGFVYTALWQQQAEAGLEAARRAMSEHRKKGGKLPRILKPFEDVDLDSLTPHDFWVRFSVAPFTPLRREQTAEDIGRAVVYFASDDARNVTGQVLMIDGGMVMR